MRKIWAVALAAVLVSSAAFAAGSNGMLAPGKPAGVKQAQTGAEMMFIVVTTAGLGMVAALAGGGGGGGGGGSNNNQGVPTGSTP